MRITIPAGRLAGQIDRIARVLLWPLILLAIATAALEFNAWTREQCFDGPFATEGTPGSPSPVVYIGRALPANCCLEARSDDSGHPFRSTLRLWINGVEMSPSHIPHATIHEGNTSGFSHWGDYVTFSLPPGVANNSEAHITVKFPVRVRERLAWLVIGTAMPLACWIYRYLLGKLLCLIYMGGAAIITALRHDP